MTRVQFCGSISGSVARRVGESDEDAVKRAEIQILMVLSSHAKRLSDDGSGPNVGLEIDE
jgi:hypothetical protein